MFFPLVTILRVLLTGVAIWFAGNRDPRVHAPAILILLLDLFSLWLAHVIVLDPRAYIVGGPTLFWFMLGPFLPALVLADAMGVVPILAFAAAATALAVGGLVWRLLWRRSGKRIWTVVAALCGIIASFGVVELGVEAKMRIDAARIPNSCGLWPTSALEMTIKGASSFSATRHGGLHDNATAYSWSFRHGGWVRQYDCVKPGAVGCSCQD